MKDIVDEERPYPGTTTAIGNYHDIPAGNKIAEFDQTLNASGMVFSRVLMNNSQSDHLHLSGLEYYEYPDCLVEMCLINVPDVNMRSRLGKEYHNQFSRCTHDLFEKCRRTITSEFMVIWKLRGTDIILENLSGTLQIVARHCSQRFVSFLTSERILSMRGVYDADQALYCSNDLAVINFIIDYICNETFQPLLGVGKIYSSVAFVGGTLRRPMAIIKSSTVEINGVIFGFLLKRPEFAQANIIQVKQFIG